MKINYHLHTDYTVDAHEDIDANCRRAVELCFDEICITNHQEWTSVASGSYDYAATDSDWEKQISEIEAARERYPDLRIKMGVELGYVPEYEEEIMAFSRKLPFDYVLGIAHRMNGKAISIPAASKVETDIARPELIDTYRSYFRMMNGIIQLGYMDCIGHFDIVKKTLPLLPLSDFAGPVKDCIEGMKARDIGFEMNTMGWKHLNRECYPSPEILRLLFDAGIRKVTIGSDCHRVDHFDYGIAKGIQLLRDIGFKQICTFTAREPEYHDI